MVHPDDKDAVTREVLRQDRELSRGYDSYPGHVDIMGIFIFHQKLLPFFLRRDLLMLILPNKSKIIILLFLKAMGLLWKAAHLDVLSTFAC